MKAKLSTLESMLNVIEKSAGYKEAERFEREKVKKVIKKKTTPTGKSRSGNKESVL